MLGRIVVVVLMVLLLTTGLLAASGAMLAVAAYNHYAAGLPDPVAALTNIPFEQQTIIYDRTGKVELARLGDLKRELVTFDQLPGEIIDATTAIEDKDFWINPGFDPAAIVSAGLATVSGNPRGASTITQQLVRARLLPASAFEGTTYERKAREIIQSIRLTQAYPGEAGKQQIITAYLNQNFYGNQSYGVKAAAKGYFGKSLADLTLAQDAILAAIPQSPTAYDLMRNATSVCLDKIPDGQECTHFKLVVPQDSEIVVRRNKVLDLMETRSPLTGTKHTKAEYEAAKIEPVVLVPQVSTTWTAPQFVWQVRRQLGQMLCPDTPTNCPQVDTGGYRVITTLDLKMQATAEKWVYVAARAPNASNPSAVLTSRRIPASARSWILALRGHNINNAAAAVMDYRTGEVLAYVGSASYTSKGNKKFQPQFDVLADGWRQPGSAIKPVDYLIGIDDKTLTAATMLMDVVTNFGGGFTPTQADKLERGPVRVRSALQFSLNIPAIKATIMTGLDHTFARSKDFGLTFPSTAIPVLSMGIGTLEVHPIDLLGAYGTIANGGVLMPRRMIQTIQNSNGSTYWPTATDTITGKRVTSAAAAYIMTDILAGNTDKRVNPFWGKWAIFDGKTRRPAAYKTGTTSDNRDVAAYGFLAPPIDQTAPALVVGVWMGNSDNTPNDGKLSLDTSAPLWSAILTEISQGTKIAQFKPPGDRPRDGDGRRLHGAPAGAVHQQDRQRVVHDGHRAHPEADAPDRGRDRRRHRSAVAGRVRRTEGHARLLQPLGGRGEFPGLAEGECRLGRARRQGARRPGRPEGHRDLVLLYRRLRPVRAHLGCSVRSAGNLPALYGAASDLQPVRVPDAAARPPDADLHPDPDLVRRPRLPFAEAALRLARAPGSRQNSTMVAPSPPSPR